MHLPSPVHRARILAKRAVSRVRNELAWQRAAAHAPVVFTDDMGLRFTFQPWMRPHGTKLLRRSDAAGQWAAVASLIRPDDVVFDVGAHLGRFSAFVDRLLSDEGRVFAFEPVPETFWMFMENMALNRCMRVIATQSAVSDRTGRVTMSGSPPELASSNSPRKPVTRTATGAAIDPVREVAVPSTTLDAACMREGLDRIDFLKVDAGGLEKAVIEGASGLLSRRRIGRICFGVCADPLQGAGMTSREVLATLEAHGFRIYAYDATARRFTGLVHDTDSHGASICASVEPLDRVQPASNPTAVTAASSAMAA